MLVVMMHSLRIVLSITISVLNSPMKTETMFYWMIEEKIISMKTLIYAKKDAAFSNIILVLKHILADAQ